MSLPPLPKPSTPEAVLPVEPRGVHSHATPVLTGAAASIALVSPVIRDPSMIISARLRALSIQPQELVNRVSGIVLADEKFPTQREITDFVMVRGGGYSGLFRAGEPLLLEVENVVPDSCAEALVHSSLILAQWLAHRSWYPALSAAFGESLEIPHGWFDAVAAVHRRESEDPAEALNGAWVKSRTELFGNIVVRSDLPAGPSDAILRDLCAFVTPFSVARFQARIDGFIERVEEVVGTAKDLLTSERAQTGILPRGLFEERFGSAFDNQDSHRLVGALEREMEIILEGLVRSPFGRVCRIEEDRDSLAGTQIDLRHGPVGIGFGVFVASLPWVLNAHAVLAVAHQHAFGCRE